MTTETSQTLLFTKKTLKIDAIWRMVTDTEMHFEYKRNSNQRISNDENGCNHPNGHSSELANTKRLHYLSNYEKQNIHSYAKSCGGTPTPAFILPKGTELVLKGVNNWGTLLIFEIADGKFTGLIFTAYIADFRTKLKGTLKEGVELKETLRYKIYYMGKPYKIKYFNDLGKVKSSLLISFGYYQNQYEMFKQYKNRNPELQDNYVPEWIQGGKDFNEYDCKDIQIMSFSQGSRVPVPVDFDVTKYYIESMKLIDVTAQFGTAAREIYKKSLQTGDFSYLLVFIPDEYRDSKNFSSNYGYRYNNFDFSSLKESQKIKDIIKASGVKKTKKCTKFGKTAIAFQSLKDLKEVMLRLDTPEYIILDCDGDQLLEQNTRFIKLQMLKETIKENREKSEN